MSYQIDLPAEWTLPNFRFLQPVCFQYLDTEEFGIIIGLEYQACPTCFDLEVDEAGWWYYLYLDEASPGYQPGLLLCRHEDELTLRKLEEVA